MRILYIVNNNDTQSIPLEVGVRMAQSDTDVLLAAFYARSSDPVEETAVPVYSLGARGVWDVRGVWNLWRLIRTSRPDIVHVHHTWSAFWGSIFGALVGVPVVKTVHNNNRHGRPYQKMLNAVAFTLADWIVCNSSTTYHSLLFWERLATGERYSVIYNGVDVQRIAEHRRSSSEGRKTLGVPADATVIGSVGRMVEQKNFGRLIEAVALLNPSMPHLYLVLVGGGKLLESHRALAERHGIADRVLFTGPLLRDDVYALLDAFDVYVMPSSWEGFCNAVVEAMVAQRVVVCSDIRTLREVVGEHALYADSACTMSLAEALATRLDMSHAQRVALGEAAATFARRRYTIDRTANAYTETYRRLHARQKNKISVTPRC